MSDWQVGDLALCINRGLLQCAPTVFHNGKLAPKYGAMREVMKVAYHPPLANGRSCGCVVLGLSDGSSGLARRFIKVTPTEADEFDRETLTLEQHA